MLNTKLILIDGIPGSGKSTTGKLISDRMNPAGIRNRFYHELEDNHPLRIYDRVFTSFEIEEQAQWYVTKVKERFEQFVHECQKHDEIAIMESYMFQDNISFAFNLGMPHELILELATHLQQTIEELHPVLIYFWQPDVERQWRFICDVRGSEWAARFGLTTDEAFRQAGETWSKNQEFVHSIVERWEIPKLVIRNDNYLWDDYIRRIGEFLELKWGSEPA